MADASALGIHPPSTVRIDMSGWVQDWPWHQVELEGDRVRITLAHLAERRKRPPAARQEQTCVTYYYEHARQLDDGTWIFHGREDFTVTAGPPQAPSVN